MILSSGKRVLALALASFCATLAFLAPPAEAKHSRHHAPLGGVEIGGISAATSSSLGSNGGLMDALYEQGIKGYYDGVSVRFYTLVLASMRRFREVQLAHGDHTPLWLDEFGWSSCWPEQKTEEELGCVTPAVQAQNITNAFRELAEARYAAAVVPFMVRDNASDEQFGEITTTGRRKPSFAALAQVLASPFGRPSPTTLRLRASHGAVVASGSGPVGDYMRLEAFEAGSRRESITFSLNRFNRYKLKLARSLGTRNLTVRVWQYWLGSGKATQRHLTFGTRRIRHGA